MQAELQIHKKLSSFEVGGGHPNIVKFHHFFEDERNVYMLLELCPNQTLSDLIKKRKTLTEFECRYYAL
jgi:polo-like kinase 1